MKNRQQNLVIDHFMSQFGITSKTSDFLSLLELRPLEFLWFYFWSCVFKCIPYNNRNSDTWIEGNSEQIKIFISAYDADKARVKEIIIQNRLISFECA